MTVMGKGSKINALQGVHFVLFIVGHFILLLPVVEPIEAVRGEAMVQLEPNDHQREPRQAPSRRPALSQLSDVAYSGPSIVAEGDTFALRCRLSVFDSARWTLNGRVVEVDSSQQRISIAERIEKKLTRLVTLTVQEASLNDAGDYRCNSFSRLSHRLDVVPAASRSPGDGDEGEEEEKMTIAAQAGLSFVVEPGERLVVPCNHRIINASSPSGGRLAPVRWFKNGEEIPREDSADQTTSAGGDARRNVNDISGSLVLSPALATDVGGYLCQAEGRQMANDVPILLRARVKVERFPQNLRVLQFTDLRLECKATGYPLPRLRWFVDNRELTGLDTDQEVGGSFSEQTMEVVASEQGYPGAVLLLRNLSDIEHRAHYTCRAENVISRDESSVFVTIRRNSIITNEPGGLGQGVELIPNSKYQVLQCNHTGQRQLRDWTKDGVPLSSLDQNLRDRIRTSNENNSLVMKVDRQDRTVEGAYQCNFVDGESFTIQVRARPDVVIEADGMTPNGASMNVIESDRIALVCRIKDEQPTTVTDLNWFIGEDLDSLNPVTEENNPRISINGTQSLSRLVIPSAGFGDRAYYVCTAKNQVKSSRAVILVRVKDKLAALWPFLGIVGEVVILCTIIFIYEKRRSKQEFDESDTDNNAEGKSPQTAAKGQEVRQRK